MKKYEPYYSTPSKHILNNLSLLGVTSHLSLLQCKLPLQQSSLPKLPYFIIFHSLKHLTQEYKSLANWYPPRTLSDQIQFKKITMEILIRLQNEKKLPKNFVIDKRALDDSDRIVDVLRFLTEFALRQSFMDQYSDLVQIGLALDSEGINRYYPQVLIDNKYVDQDVLELFQTHIDMMRSKLIEKSTFQPFTLPLNFEQLRVAIDYQNEIKSKLSKVPKELFSENRELDRIQIIDKINEIWRALDLSVNEVEIGENEFVEGEKELISIDQEWESWLRRLVGGLKDLTKKNQEQQIRNPKRMPDLNRMLSQIEVEIKDLKQFKQDIESIMMD